MVTIIDYKKCLNEAGKEFFTLSLQGDIELVKSSVTGNFYATAKKASITSTFDEEGCKKMIGKTLPGNIVKVEAEVYDYCIPETNEVVQLDFKYMYNPQSGALEEAVFNQTVVTA